ncbi:MAG: DUF86 domain-containing protein [Firmicutes bacterium]|nr:DUF86 domain-containing protein [Bacillota bacterium]
MTSRLDYDTIHKHLQNIQESLTVLEQMRNIPLADFKEDIVRSWAVERGLERCIQNVLDIGGHILASIGVSLPSEYRQTILQLGEQGVLPTSFAEQMAPMAGFRNLLVHEYLQIDFDRVYDMLHNHLDDFRAFAYYVAEFMKSNGG